MKPKAKKKTVIKAWMYQFPEDKNITDGQMRIKRLEGHIVRKLSLKETEVTISF